MARARKDPRHRAREAALQILYQWDLAHRDIVLPRRQRPAGYTEPGLPLRHIPTPF